MAVVKKDISRITYKELFNIKLLHDGYTLGEQSEIFNQINVVPDAATNALFNRYGMGYRCINDTIICFIKTEAIAPPAKDPQRPFIRLNEPIMIRFLITVQTGFLNKTYTAAAGSSYVYHFTNKIDNVQNSNRYITKTLDVYKTDGTYDAGTIVKNGANEPYVTVKPVNKADAIAITNEAYWKKVLPFAQVVNNADLDETTTVVTDQPCFAVIDVFNGGTANATYDLFGTGQQLLSPVYIIPFKSRI